MEFLEATAQDPSRGGNFPANGFVKRNAMRRATSKSDISEALD
jgi:hypothetical protein